MKLVTLTLNITEDQIYNGLIEVFSDITGLDPNKGEIRRAYQLQSQPGWRHTDNVISFWLTNNSDIYHEDIMDSYDFSGPMVKNSTFTQVLSCNISCYGPNSKDMALLIWAGIQSDENRLALSKLKIYPVPKNAPPNYVPYQYNNQWWNRTDITLIFNVYTNISNEINSIKSVEINLNNKIEKEIK